MDNEPVKNCDIVLHLSNDQMPLRRNSELNTAYDLLQYPLIFHNGSQGGTAPILAATTPYHTMIGQNNDLLHMATSFSSPGRLQFLWHEQTGFPLFCGKFFPDIIPSYFQKFHKISTLTVYTLTLLVGHYNNRYNSYQE